MNEVKEILKTLKENEALIPHFFKYQAEGFALFHPLRDKKYFDPSKNPGLEETKNEKGETFTRALPWPALIYLLRLAKESKEKEKLTEAQEIYDIIKDITFLSPERNNFHTWSVLSEILSALPKEILFKAPKEDLVKIYESWLNNQFPDVLIINELRKNILPTFLENKKQLDKVLALFDLISQVSTISEPGTRCAFKYFSPIDHYEVKRLFETISPELGKKGWLPFSKLFITRIKEAYKIAFPRGIKTALVRISIEDHEQNIHNQEPFDILLLGLREGSLAYLGHEKDQKEGEKYLNNLFQQDGAIFQRMALFLIGPEYEKYQKVFWEHFSKEMLNAENQHELYLLVDKNFPSFTDTQKDLYLKTIEKIKSEDPEVSEEINQKRAAYQKLTWLSPTITKGYEKADDLFNETLKITDGVKPRHPGYSFKVETRRGTGPSLYTKDQILEKTNEKIVSLCNSFKEKGGLDDPSADSLGLTLKEAIAEKPKKFLGDFKPFLGLNEPYISNFLSGIQEIQEEERYLSGDVSIPNTLKLVDAFLEHFKKLNTKPLEEQDLKQGYLINLLARTLIKIAKHPKLWEREIPENLENLLFKVLNFPLLSERDKYNRGFIQDAINNNQGEATQGIVNLVWGLKDDTEPGANPAVKKAMERLWAILLPPAEKYIYSYAILGQFLPTLFHVDEKGSKKFLKEIADAPGDEFSKAVLEGYSYNGQVFEIVYNALKENGLLNRVFEFENSDLVQKIKDRYIQIIIIAYLNFQEDLEDPNGLMALLLNRFKSNEIVKAIDTFRSVGNHPKPKKNEIQPHVFHEKVLKFWELSLEKVKEKPVDEGMKKILSTFIQLLPFLPNLKGKYQDWLKTSIPHIGEYYESYRFFGGLVDFLEKDSIKEVGEVLRFTFQKLQNNPRLSYKKENIITILEALDETGETELAMEVQGLIIRRGDNIDWKPRNPHG
ncbi:MAG: hypothetical protein IIA70_04575 [Proteobacteria bacterium]|nr:hypothetical protein [Pseudomonadota bacterium]